MVTFSAGGSTDLTARIVADNLRPLLGQSVLVDNKPGAGGNIGAVAVAKSDPDGYTLLMATSTHATNPSLYANPGYDFAQDFAPVAQIALIPNLLVVGPAMPVGNLAEFIAYVKENKGPVNYGSAGNGSSQHLSAALFNSMVGGKMQHVPYKGGAPANTDLLAGQIQVLFAPLVEVIAHVKAGKLGAAGRDHQKAFALAAGSAGHRRGAARLRGGVVERHIGAGKTPPEIVAVLNDAIVKVLNLPEVRAKLAEQGSEPVGQYASSRVPPDDGAGDREVARPR